MPTCAASCSRLGASSMRCHSDTLLDGCSCTLCVASRRAAPAVKSVWWGSKEGREPLRGTVHAIQGPAEGSGSITWDHEEGGDRGVLFWGRAELGVQHDVCLVRSLHWRV
jgi:hypothetical protein